MRPESKFLNGDYVDRGRTERRHVRAVDVAHIGKEANKWEEQFFTGPDEEAQIEYGADPKASSVHVDELKLLIEQFGGRAIALQIGISRNTLRKIIENPTACLSPGAINKISNAITALKSEKSAVYFENLEVLRLAKADVDRIGIVELARRLKIDRSNLSKVIKEERVLDWKLATALRQHLSEMQINNYGRNRG